MLARSAISISTGIRSVKPAARAAFQVFIPVLLLGGLLHATPIMNTGAGELQDAKRFAVHKSAQPATKAPSSADEGQRLTLNDTASSDSYAGGCVFNNSCYSTIKVPEPQSLVLVGTGLLSLAGLIRRRLVR
jgi:hypothetical protein